MAEPKKKKIISADTGEEVAAGSKRKEPKPAAPVGNATPLRIGAIVLWVLAIVFEVLGLLVIQGKLDMKFMPQMYQMILFLVLDLACVIIGSQLWKKANHIKPASEKNPFLFWLWNNMGVVVCCIAFVPFVILLLTNKDVDKKTKTIGTVVAIIALLIGGASSIDYNPVSAEQQEAAMEAIQDDVYWTRFGHVYHTHTDCQALNQSEELTYGTVEQAIAANRTRLCAFCAKRDAITGVVTDDANTDGYVVEEQAADETAQEEVAETETESEEAA
ncbi:MAG: hypothetical protein J5927_02885 [Oscillospiraceae bacterium]|nr:hypothetical protein [Oscillospiraceae bacterium]